MCRKRISLTLFGLLGSLAAPAQFMPGLMSSNYGGIYRTLQNPSAVVGTRYTYQLVVAGNSAVSNRYFRRPFTDDYLHTLQLPYRNDIRRDLQSIGSITENPRHTTYTELIGPSLLLSLGKRNAIAVHSRFSNVLYGTGMPRDLTQAYARDLFSTSVQPTSGAFAASLTQQHGGELGFTYGLRVFEGRLHRLSVGATVRRLFGGSYRQLELSSNYRIDRSQDGIKTIELNGLSYALYNTNPRAPFRLNAGGYGTGWAYDLGATYELGKATTGRAYNDESPFSDPRPAYFLRLSAALMNNGSGIRYPGPQGYQQQGQAVRVVLDQPALDRFGNDVVAGLPQLAPGNAQERPIEPRTVAMPRRLHLEADLRLTRSVYVNALSMTNLGGAAPQLPDMLIITPRFEDEDAEFALPISVIDGNDKLSVGMSARLGPIAFGFSNLSGMLNKNAQHRGTFAWLGLSVWGVRGVMKNR